MTDSEEKDRILKAFVDEFKCYPEKPQELMAFTKRSEALTNLKYTEATKLIHYSKRQSNAKKKPKNGVSNVTKYKISPKMKGRSRTASKYKILPKKKQKSNKSLRSHSNQLNHTKMDSPRHKNSKNMDYNYKIGDHVILTQDREGIIRYIGNVAFATGTMYGIELKEGALGRHDGKVHNKRYFTAPKQRGIFVKPSRIRRKLRQRDRNSSFKLNRSAAIQQLKKRNSIKQTNSTDKTRWKAPYEVYEISNNIERTSMRKLYTKASSNLHQHILQKVNQQKIRNDIRNSMGMGVGLATQLQRSAFCSAHSAASKLHSPMIPIHIMPVNTISSPIITTETVSTKTMQGITRKMMKRARKKRKKRSSLIMHKRPHTDNNEKNNNNKTPPIAIATTVTTATTTAIVHNATNPFALEHARDPEDAYDDEKQTPQVMMESMMSPITFSPRNAADATAAVAPPLSQVTINYVEMEDKVNALIKLLIARDDIITDVGAVYAQCEITTRDLNEDLFGWVDLLCTHSDLFAATARIKHVTKENSFFASKKEDIERNDIEYLEDDDDEESDCGTATSDSTDDAQTIEREKVKETLRRKNALLMRNAATDYFCASDTYHYTVFERLLFELHFFYLYFIYDIGLDNCSAFSEQHPSQLFLLSGNMSQILRKCSPVTYDDIERFKSEILSPYELGIRYQYLNNCDGKCNTNTIEMTKYDEQDGIRNDYNFVGRIQYDEMFDNNTNGECDANSDLHYELICSGVTIYKSVIPSVFSICADLRITNLKRSIYSPSLVLGASDDSASCHIECEKWNDEGDYYGFIRIAVDHEMMMNAQSVICASECGYYKQMGFGVGNFANVRKEKTKYYSGGGYATSAAAPHDSCPAAACYGDDCLQNNYLYYGSPSYDENERGGGIIDIVCKRRFTNHGHITANGANGMQFGGSSGGSIKIVAATFINERSGRITANGGKGAVYQRKGSKRKQCGTDGGDGRIFIICNTFVNKGTISPAPTVISPIPDHYTNDHNIAFSHIKSLNPQTTF